MREHREAKAHNGRHSEVNDNKGSNPRPYGSAGAPASPERRWGSK